MCAEKKKKIFSFLLFIYVKRVNLENIFRWCIFTGCREARQNRDSSLTLSIRKVPCRKRVHNIVHIQGRRFSRRKRGNKKRGILACRNITTISGTKSDGEVRVLNSHEWHEVVYARGIPSASFFFFPTAFFLLRRCAWKTGEEREQGGTTGWERTEGGRCTQWAFFWKIKVQRRHRVAELCRAAARVKIKIARKNVGRAKCERWREGEEWAGGRGVGVLACNLKASRCFSHGPKEAIRIPAGDQ